MANDKPDVLHGSLVLMVLRTLDTLGPQHGWGIARRIEQISGDALELNQGTLYPALLRLEQMGWISTKWGASEKDEELSSPRETHDGHECTRINRLFSSVFIRVHSWLNDSHAS